MSLTPSSSLATRRMPGMAMAAFLAVNLVAGGHALGQTAAPIAARAPVANAAGANQPVEQREERLVQEDAGSRIEELRVGGETRTITVQPKGGMPAYEVQPGGPGSNNPGGTRVWKMFGF